MDPTTLIITALTAVGQTIGVKAVEDAYSGLKELIKKKFAGDPKAEIVLAEHRQKPEVWEKPLREAITEAGVDKDEEIVEAAEALLSLVKSQGEVKSKYNVEFKDKVMGVTMGDDNTVTQTFHNS